MVQDIPLGRHLAISNIFPTLEPEQEFESKLHDLTPP
jgi:hypothetical protein